MSVLPAIRIEDDVDSPPSVFREVPTLDVEPSSSAAYLFQLHVYANTQPHRVAYLMRTADQFERIVYCVGENVDGSQVCCLTGAVPFEMMRFRDFLHAYRSDSKRPIWRTHVAHTTHETDFQIIDLKSNRVLRTVRLNNDTGHVVGLDAQFQASARKHVSIAMVATIVFSGRFTSDEALGPWLEAFQKGVVDKFSL
jgi:hypothetical protein